MEGRRPPPGSLPNSVVVAFAGVALAVAVAAVVALAVAVAYLAGFEPWAAGSWALAQSWASPRNGQE